MLLNLNFKVTFPSTGKTLSGSHDFQTGLSAITGPNESGKSFRLEMIRYALWGTKALRSKATSYKDLFASLAWRIGDDEYTVTRTPTKALLLKNNTEMAIGTSPVNAAIETAFGYNMEVFDVSNACLQGEVEALTHKTPAERKRMVDKVLGLDSIDELIAEVGAEISAKKQLAVMLEARIRTDIVKPISPDNYVKSAAELEAEKKELQTRIDNYLHIAGRVSALQCSEPDPAPVRTEMVEMSTLYALQSQYQVLQERLHGLHRQLETYKGVNTTIVVLETLEQLELYESTNTEHQWDKYHEWVNTVQAMEALIGTVTKEEMEAINKAMLALPDKRALESIESHKLTCPECKHEFSLEQSKIEEARKKIEGIDFSVIEGWTIGDYYEIENAMKRLDDLKAKPVIQPCIPEIKTDWKASLALLRARKEKEQSQAKVNLELDAVNKELAAFDFDIDYRIGRRREEDDKVKFHEGQVEKYKLFTEFCERNADVLQAGPDWLKEREAINILHNTAVFYEQQMAKYMLESARNEETKEELANVKVELENLMNLRTGLNNIKPKVKKHLIPSMNKVASNLLSQMTNGVRTVVEVNEDFEIKVDNQAVEELSGSGKAVANLAVRIALGTVLTNRVLSTLMMDEIDASMDKDRAGFTAQCLRNLTGTFKQIILVSHQKPDADHQIELQ